MVDNVVIRLPLQILYCQGETCFLMIFVDVFCHYLHVLICTLVGLGYMGSQCGEIQQIDVHYSAVSSNRSKQNLCTGIIGR